MAEGWWWGWLMSVHQVSEQIPSKKEMMVYRLRHYVRY